jgi:hypothetical protein
MDYLSYISGFQSTEVIILVSIYVALVYLSDLIFLTLRKNTFCLFF